MKKLLLAAMMLLSFQMVSAQVKGEMFVGGTLGLTTGTEGTAFNIAPEFGYFVAPNVRVGAALSYGVTSGPSHSFSVGPNVAYYLELAPNFFYMPELALEYVNMHKSDGLAVKLALFACEYKINHHIGLTAKVAGLEYVGLFNEIYDHNEFVFNLAFKPTVGFVYYF